jgi:hypothetical protein
VRAITPKLDARRATARVRLLPMVATGRAAPCPSPPEMLIRRAKQAPARAV